MQNFKLDALPHYGKQRETNMSNYYNTIYDIKYHIGIYMYSV